MNRAVIAFPLIIFSLLVAVWSGWIRIGWTLPLTAAAAQHGALMVNSFLASLIFLERAVTFKNRFVLLVPIVNALSVVPFVLQQPEIAQAFIVAGSLGFMLICLYFVYRHKEFYYYVFLVAAACLTIGNIVLLKTHLYAASSTWWMGFLLFTIVAERLELTRFLPLTKSRKGLLVLSLLIVLVGLFLPFHLYGNYFLSAGIGATALWLLRYDMARRSLKVKGQHRYSALLLLTGFAWLLVTALLLVVGNKFAFWYDALLHSFFIGFVFSMIFSHAPIIFPAVTRLPIKIFRPVLYVWFALMQLSLIIRIIADVAPDVLWRKIAGLTNGAAILLFFITIGATVIQEARKRKAPARTAAWA